MKREDLVDLQSFAVVAEERSFTRAAARLGVSSSALGHALELLEGRLGTKLLHRTTRSVSPTSAGARLLTLLGPTLARLEAGLTLWTADPVHPTGTVRIGVHRTTALLLVVPKLRALRERHPDVVVELALEDEQTDIVAAGFDAGICHGERIAKDMVAVRIGPSHRTAVVAAPSYLAAHAAPKSPDDLVHHACLGYRIPASGMLHGWQFEKAGRRVQVSPEPAFVCNDSDVVMHSALAGLGVAYLLEAQVAAHLEAGTLVRVLEPWSVEVPGSFLHYSSKRPPTAALRVVLDALRMDPEPATRSR